MLALLRYHPRATHHLRNICIQEASTDIMAPTTIREPYLRMFLPHIYVRLSSNLSFLFFPPCCLTCCGSANNTKASGGIGIGIAGTEEFFLSLHSVPSGRLKKEFGHFVEGGAGMTPPYLFVIIISDNLVSPTGICCWAQISVVTRYSHFTQGVLIPHLIRPGATSKFFPPFFF